MRGDISIAVNVGYLAIADGNIVTSNPPTLCVTLSVLTGSGGSVLSQDTLGLRLSYIRING
jgi:hypothetical protein